MLADPEGREILLARPVINEATVDLVALAVCANILSELISQEQHFGSDGHFA